jgi:hypothetical protein
VQTLILYMQGGTDGDYGARASADLIVTRGAGFRKEKNKKKKGSYRGGMITVCYGTNANNACIDALPCIDAKPQYQV